VHLSVAEIVRFEAADETLLTVISFHCSGLIVHPEGPLNPDKDSMSISEMFRPFQTLLFKIRYVFSSVCDIFCSMYDIIRY